jgi:chromosome segregation ATPase
MNISLERRIAEMKFSYENEIETLRSEIDENEKKFITYKERAQVALKRMTKEEQDVKRKAQVQEESHVKIFIEQIAQLESKLDDLTSELSCCHQELSRNSSKLQEFQEYSKQVELSKKESNERIRKLEEELVALSKDLDTERQSFAKKIHSLCDEHNLQVERLKTEHQQIILSKTMPSVVAKSGSERQFRDSHAVTLSLDASASTSVESPLQSIAIKQSASFEIQDSNQGTKSMRPPEYRENWILGTPAYKTPNRSLLFSHAEGDLTINLQHLRDENAALSANYNEVKQEFALILEQVTFNKFLM